MTATLPPDLLAALSHLVEAQFGLHYPAARAKDLERAVRAAAKELGLAQPAGLLELLLAEAPDKGTLEALARNLTIGETYFYRDPEAFTALEREVLPQLIRERRERGRRLRIWSAGCCTGEEPYSIAMALTRVLPDIGSWHITILATDINGLFLEKARRGVYTAWSFRSTPPAIKSAFFHPLPQGRFEVIPAIKKLVTFAELNLAEDAYPAIENNTQAMDLIVCRNVLMYFTRARAKRVAAALHRALVEGGWFLTSAAEASAEMLGMFHRAGPPSVALYRKMAGERVHAKTPAPPPPSEDRAGWKPAPQPAPAPPVRPAPCGAGFQPTLQAPPALDHAASARALANEGQLDAALSAADAAITAQKLDPAHHYLQGAILQEQGESAAAIASMRRALYLDPELAVAHFALGNLLERAGRAREAQRCFENVRRLLASFDPQSVVPESDGLTAGQMLALVNSMLEAV